MPTGQPRGRTLKQRHECPGSHGRGALDRSPTLPRTRGVHSGHTAPPAPRPSASGLGQPLLASLPLPLSDTVILGPRGPAPPPAERIRRWGHAPPGPAGTRTQADAGPAGAGGAAHPRARAPGPSPACGDQTHARGHDGLHRADGALLTWGGSVWKQSP